MTIAFSLVIALIATTPILLLMQGSTELAFVAFVSSLALVHGASKATLAELERLAGVLRRVGLLLVVPAAWMIVQILPLPLAPPSHQIWTSAAAAIPDLSFGHVTMNVADTVRALGLYCGWLVLVLATMVVTVDRRRAEICLATLVLVTTATAAVGVALSLPPDRPTIEARESFNAAPAAAAAFGCVLSLAAIQRLFDRARAHRPRSGREAAGNALLAICNVSAFVICLAAALFLSSAAWIAALLGVLTFAAVALMNRFGFPNGSRHAIVGVFALTAAVILLAKSANTPTGSILTSVVSTASADSIAIADRMLNDSTWLGTGAGTYGRLIPVYEELGRTPPVAAPSLALKLAIEWGWVSPALLTLCALFVASTFVRASMLRGRDSFYPAAAAACLASLTFQAYGDASLLNPALGLLSAVIVGLALAQARGRSASG